MFGGLANLVAAAHGLIAAFILVSALAAVVGRLHRHRRWEIAFYLLLAPVILFDFLPDGCPVTVWENHLRELDRPGSGYRDSFIAHYLPFVPMHLYNYFIVALVVAAILAAPFWRWQDRRRSGGVRAQQ